MTTAATRAATDDRLVVTRAVGVGGNVRSWVAPMLVGSVVTLLYTAYSAWQWSIVVVRSWDLGIFTSLARKYAAGEPPIVSIKGDGFNLLGDHFHPLLILLGPIFALFPHAFTLLVVQSVCFGAAAAIIAWGARSVLTPVASACFGLAFGLSWGLQGAAEAQFHEIAFAVPLLAASLVALLRERWIASAMWAAPLVFVKEDLGFTVFAIGILLAWRFRRPAALWLSVWGVAWFAIATLVVLPLLNPSGAWQYGGTMNPIAVMTDPTMLFAEQKFRTLGLLLLVTAGIGLRSPIALLLLPTLAWRFLSTNYGYWGPTWHYSAVLMPIAYVAVLDGIRMLRTSPRAGLARWARSSGWIVVGVSAALLPILPLWGLVNGDATEPAPRAQAAWAVIAAIPAGASVESDLSLLSYVAEDHETYWSGNTNPAQDCILLDSAAGGLTSDAGSAVLAFAAQRHPDRTYEFVVGRDGYELACVASR